METNSSGGRQIILQPCSNGGKASCPPSASSFIRGHTSGPSGFIHTFTSTSSERSCDRAGLIRNGFCDTHSRNLSYNENVTLSEADQQLGMQSISMTPAELDNGSGNPRRLPPINVCQQHKCPVSRAYQTWSLEQPERSLNGTICIPEGDFIGKEASLLTPEMLQLTFQGLAQYFCATLTSDDELQDARKSISGVLGSQANSRWHAGSDIHTSYGLTVVTGKPKSPKDLPDDTFTPQWTSVMPTSQPLDCAICPFLSATALESKWTISSTPLSSLENHSQKSNDESVEPSQPHCLCSLNSAEASDKLLRDLYDEYLESSCSVEGPPTLAQDTFSVFAKKTRFCRHSPASDDVSATVNPERDHIEAKNQNFSKCGNHLDEDGVSAGEISAKVCTGRKTPMMKQKWAPQALVAHSVSPASLACRKRLTMTSRRSKRRTPFS